MTTERTPQRSEPGSRLLEAEIEELRQRLEDAESTLEAISGGRVDALVVADPLAERQVMLLEDARRGARLPIDRLRQGAVTVGGTGEILHVNAAFAALLGIDAQRLFGLPIAELVASTDHPVLAALLADRAPSPLAALGLASPAGVELRVRVASIPLLEGHGMCLIVTGVYDGADDEAAATLRAIQRGEIDAIVVAEREDDPQVLLLGAAGRRYRALVEHMRDGAVTLSTEGDVLYANPSFAAMVGLVPADVVGRRLAEFVDEPSRSLLDALAPRSWSSERTVGRFARCSTRCPRRTNWVSRCWSPTSRRASGSTRPKIRCAPSAAARSIRSSSSAAPRERCKHSQARIVLIG
jgi:PAS domain S-box-containing protein